MRDDERFELVSQRLVKPALPKWAGRSHRLTVAFGYRQINAGRYGLEVGGNGFRYQLQQIQLKKTSSIMAKCWIKKACELQGGTNHYYISEIGDTDGSTAQRNTALWSISVNNFATSDIGTGNVSKYLIYEINYKLVKVEGWWISWSKQQNGGYYVDVNETAGNKSLIITGWQSTTEKWNLMRVRTKVAGRICKTIYRCLDQPFGSCW